MNIREITTIIGKKRFVLVTLLVLANAGLGAFWQNVLLPQSVTLKAEKIGVDAELVRLRQEIVDLPAKYAQMKADEARFEALIAAGFKEEQDRIVANRIIDAVRARSGLSSVDYSIQPAVKITHPQSYLLNGEDIYTSTVSVTMHGLTDLDFRRFTEELAKNFRGLLVLKLVSYERKQGLTPDVLARLGRGDKLDLVEGKADFDWISIVPNGGVVDPAAAAFGGGM